MNRRGFFATLAAVVIGGAFGGHFCRDCKGKEWIWWGNKYEPYDQWKARLYPEWTPSEELHRHYCMLTGI